MIAKVPKFRARLKDGVQEVEGVYFAYPSTMHCVAEDGPVEMKHCLCIYRTMDWGLPTQAYLAEIDTGTLIKIGEEEVCCSENGGTEDAGPSPD